MSPLIDIREKLRTTPRWSHLLYASSVLVPSVAICVVYKPRWNCYGLIVYFHFVLLQKLMVWLRSVFALVSIGLVRASAVKRQTVTQLGTAQIDGFAPFTHFASTAYCNPSTTINWSCGGSSLSHFPTHSSAWSRVTEGLLPQPTATRTLTFNRWQLEETAQSPSFVGEQLLTCQ
jgi:hypothetical protein